MDGYGHLVRYLTELGYAGSNGMGRAPLSYQEIESWSRLTQTPLAIYEVEELITLSRIYVTTAVEAQEPSCPPPYVPEAEVTVEQRKQVDSFFRGLVGRQKAKHD